MKEISLKDMTPMSEFPEEEGMYLVYMPDSKRKPFQVMYWNENITIIGHSFSFDLPEPTHFVKINGNLGDEDNS